ncbi:hypothetical protein [Marinithermofilum abyssi]|uniref:hypothetical protein n=1 Tax=Marinithermofilum abyssi TaxID=1571185 RepID=UPI0027E59DF3|nr:hypothetical protein [Marinithermofilum abyssi]
MSFGIGMPYPALWAMVRDTVACVLDQPTLEDILLQRIRPALIKERIQQYCTDETG